jgi:hypothetical protein
MGVTLAKQALQAKKNRTFCPARGDSAQKLSKYVFDKAQGKHDQQHNDQQFRFK